MKNVTCEICGANFEANDLYDLFEDGQNHYTCDECYQKIQAEGRAAAKEVAKEWN